MRALAVALHDVEPATFERCALIRDWLSDHGVGRVTLLVIPARDLHAFDQRSPALATWLAEQRAAGDAIAQHGFRHEQLRRGPLAGPPMMRERGAEFAGLDARETDLSVEAGRRVLRLAGIEPRGFVAPAYAYTPALHETLRRTFDWWASLHAIHRRAEATPLTADALGLTTAGMLRWAVSPALVRLRASLAGDLLRLDLHPADFDRSAHVLALERVLTQAAGRIAVTYDELSEGVVAAPPALAA